MKSPVLRIISIALCVTLVVNSCPAQAIAISFPKSAKVHLFQQQAIVQPALSGIHHFISHLCFWNLMGTVPPEAIENHIRETDGSAPSPGHYVAPILASFMVISIGLYFWGIAGALLCGGLALVPLMTHGTESAIPEDILARAERAYQTSRFSKNRSRLEQSQRAVKYLQSFYQSLGLQPDTQALSAALLLLASDPTEDDREIRKLNKTPKERELAARIARVRSIVETPYRIPAPAVSKKLLFTDRVDALEFQEMVSAMAAPEDDILVALAHKFAAIEVSEADNRESLFTEIRQVYATLFQRIGDGKFADTLRDRAFEIANPDGFQKAQRKINTTLDMTQENQQKRLDKYKSELERKLKGLDVSRIEARVKSPYSVHRKTRNVQDFFGLRVVLTDFAKRDEAVAAVSQYFLRLGFEIHGEQTEEKGLKPLDPKDPDFKAFHISYKKRTHRGDTDFILEVQFFLIGDYEEYLYGKNAEFAYKLGYELGMDPKKGERLTVVDRYLPVGRDSRERFANYQTTLCPSWVRFLVPVKYKGKEYFLIRRFARRPDPHLGNLADAACEFGRLEDTFRGFTVSHIRQDLLTGGTATANQRSLPPSYVVQNGDVIDLLAKNTARKPMHNRNPQLQAALASASRVTTYFKLLQFTGADFETLRREGDKQLTAIVRNWGFHTFQGEVGMNFYREVLVQLAHERKMQNPEQLFILFGSEWGRKSDFPLWNRLKELTEERGRRLLAAKRIPIDKPELSVRLEALAAAFRLPSLDQLILAVGLSIISADSVAEKWTETDSDLRIHTDIVPRITDRGRIQTFELSVPDQTGLVLRLRELAKAHNVQIVADQSKSAGGVAPYKMILLQIDVEGAEDNIRAFADRLQFSLMPDIANLTQPQPDYRPAELIVVFQPRNRWSEQKITERILQTLTRFNINISVNPGVTRSSQSGIVELRYPLGIPPDADWKIITSDLGKISGIKAQMLAEQNPLRSNGSGLSRLKAQERLRAFAWGIGAGTLAGILMAVTAQLTNHLDLGVITLEEIFANYAATCLNLFGAVVVANYACEWFIHEAHHIREAIQQGFLDAGLLRWKPWGDLIVVEDATDKFNPKPVDLPEILAAGPRASGTAARWSAIVLVAGLMAYVGLMMGPARTSMKPLVSIIVWVTLAAATTAINWSHNRADQTRLLISQEEEQSMVRQKSDDPATFLLILIDELERKGWEVTSNFGISKENGKYNVVIGAKRTPAIKTSVITVSDRLGRDVDELSRIFYPAQQPIPNAHRRLLEIKVPTPRVFGSLISWLKDKDIFMESVEPVSVESGTLYRCVLSGPDPSYGAVGAAEITRLTAELGRDLTTAFGAGHVTLRDFTPLHISRIIPLDEGRPPTHFFLELLNTENQPNVLLAILEQIRRMRWTINELQMRPLVKGVGGMETTLVIAREPETMDSIDELESALKNIEFPPGQRHIERPNDVLTINFNLFDLPGSLYTVIQQVAALKANIDRADVDLESRQPKYGLAEFEITPLVGTRISQVENALKNASLPDHEPKSAEPLVINIQTSVAQVSRASAFYAADLIRTFFASTGGDLRDLLEMEEKPDDLPGEVDHKIFIPNIKKALEILRLVHGGPNVTFWWTRGIFRWIPEELSALIRHAVWRIALLLPLSDDLSSRLAGDWPATVAQKRKINENIYYAAHPTMATYNLIAQGDRSQISLEGTLLHDTIEDIFKAIYGSIYLGESEQLISEKPGAIEKLFKNPHDPDREDIILRFALHFRKLAPELRALVGRFERHENISKEEIVRFREKVYDAVQELLRKRIRHELRAYSDQVINRIEQMTTHTNMSAHATDLARRRLPSEWRDTAAEQTDDNIRTAFQVNYKFGCETISKNVRNYCPIFLQDTYIRREIDEKVFWRYFHALITEAMKAKSLEAYRDKNKRTGEYEPFEKTRAETIEAIDLTLAGLNNLSNMHIIPTQEIGEEKIQHFRNLLIDLRRRLIQERAQQRETEDGNRYDKAFAQAWTRADFLNAVYESAHKHGMVVVLGMEKMGKTPLFDWTAPFQNHVDMARKFVLVDGFAGSTPERFAEDLPSIIAPSIPSPSWEQAKQALGDRVLVLDETLGFFNEPYEKAILHALEEHQIPFVNLNPVTSALEQEILVYKAIHSLDFDIFPLKPWGLSDTAETVQTIAGDDPDFQSLEIDQVGLQKMQELTGGTLSLLPRAMFYVKYAISREYEPDLSRILENPDIWDPDRYYLDDPSFDSPQAIGGQLSGLNEEELKILSRFIRPVDLLDVASWSDDEQHTVLFLARYGYLERKDHNAQIRGEVMRRKIQSVFDIKPGNASQEGFLAIGSAVAVWDALYLSGFDPVMAFIAAIALAGGFSMLHTWRHMALGGRLVAPAGDGWTKKVWNWLRVGLQEVPKPDMTSARFYLEPGLTQFMIGFPVVALALSGWHLNPILLAAGLVNLIQSATLLLSDSTGWKYLRQEARILAAA